MWAGNAQWMSVATIWSLLLLHVSFLMVHLVPSVITASVLDLICLAAHGFLAFLVSPLGSPNFNDVFILQLVGFMVLQIVFVAVAARYTGVLVSHSLVVGVVLWRVSMETDFASGEPDTVANSRTLVFCNIVCTGAVVAVHNIANQLIRHTLETTMMASDSNRHLSAASALLELTCDAVCEIDSDLKLQSHSQKLATMLLRSGTSLEGRKLTDFIAPGEAERAQEILMSRIRSDRAAHAFHTHLVDSYSSKFRTEVFQVKYAMMDGRECHLVGLRDFTDLKSLAGENATDAIQDESEMAEAASAVASASASAPSGRGFDAFDAFSEPSYEPPSDASESVLSNESNATLERTDRENGIVEKRLKYAHKDAFLEIDMEAEIVEAASAPFCSLAGKPLSQSFASDFTRELLHRLREDAIQFNAQRFQLPDQVATFQAMPIYVDRSIVMTSGVMKVSLTRYGSLNVIMCINHAEVQSFTTKTSERMDMRPKGPLAL